MVIDVGVTPGESVEKFGPQMRGTVEIISSSYGRIIGADGKIYYFDLRTCIDVDTFNELKDGTRVVFNKANGTERGLLAVNVALDNSEEVDALIPKTENVVAGILASKEIVADSPECSLEDEAFRIDSMGWSETVLKDAAGNLINAKVNTEGDILELDNGVQIFTPVAMIREVGKTGRERDMMTGEQVQWLLKNTPNNVPEGCKFAGFLNSKDGKIHFNQENACYWIGETNEKGNQKALFCIDISTVDDEMRSYTDEMIISDYDVKSMMQVRLLKKKTV